MNQHQRQLLKEEIKKIVHNEILSNNMVGLHELVTFYNTCKDSNLINKVDSLLKQGQNTTAWALVRGFLESTQQLFTVKEVMDAPPIQHIQHAATNKFSSNFVAYIKTVENGIKKGYNPQKKLWFPHKSVEGGMPTIGYGHKVKNSSELESMKKGITDSQVEKLLVADLETAEKNVHSYIKHTYKTDILLTDKQKEMLVDFAFNLGGLQKFPKFTDAVLRNQWDKVEKQYKRHANGKELTGRNTAFHDRYLK